MNNSINNIETSPSTPKVPKQKNGSLLLRGMKLLCVVLVTFPFIISWFGYYVDQSAIPLNTFSRWLFLFLFLACYFFLGRVYEAFMISYFRISELIYSQGLAVLITDAIAYVVISILSQRLVNILPLIGTALVQLFLAFSWAYSVHQWYFSRFSAKRTAVIFDLREGMETLINEYGFEKKFQVEKTLHVNECLDNFNSISDMDVVFLSGVHSRDRNIIIKYCVEHKISAFIIPRVGDLIMSGAQRMHMFHLPILRVDRYNPTPEYLFVKRAIDICVSGIALLVLSPVMLIVALAVKKDGGPVFYKQKRLTKDGRVFELIKFRSMRVDAEKDGIARLAADNDDRITPVGKIIRACRLDELPQLLNILNGSMSLVGPRPERPEIAADYEKELPEFKLRLQAKAGLTGYAQVYGKYNTTPYDKLQLDLMYIAQPSILQDLRIMFATVKILFMPESTEGVSEDQTTAMR